MKPRGRLIIGLLVLALTLLNLAPAARGQYVINTPIPNWTNSLPLPNPLINFNADGNRGFTTLGGANAVGLGGAMGTATQNSYLFFPDTSLFIYQTDFSQSFTLNASAVVQLPLYFRGSISFFGSGTNDSRGSAGGSVNIVDPANTLLLNNGDFYVRSQGNNGSINDAIYKSVTLPAGPYTVQGTVGVTGMTAITGGGSSGTGVTVDFLSGTNGVATDLGAWPTGLGGSRANVRAPQARIAFGVDGTNVRVGVLEVDRPYRNGDPIGEHPSLAGRITLLNAPTINDPNLRDEHAQAVCSIIASQDADTENAGVAPGASLFVAALQSYSAGAGNNRPFAKALNDLVGANVRVINMSATTFAGAPNGSDPSNDANLVNQTVNAHPNLLFVKSSGNSAGNVSAPGTAYNAITVGALSDDFTCRRASSSSGSTIAGLNPFKPDIMAPGSYINAASPFGGIFVRAFTGETFDTTGPLASGATTGPISGTSFAAPFVSGAAALLLQYADTHANHVDDHRVLKAVMMNTARRDVLHGDQATPWSQQTSGTATAGDPYTVLVNLDNELGAGALDVYSSLQQFKPNIVLGSAANNQQHIHTDVTGKQVWWDFSNAVSRNGADPGTVDYVLGNVSGPIRATLVWDAENDGTVRNLSLRLYQEGDTANNPDGYDPADVLIAQTVSQVTFGADPTVYYQNVGLFDSNVPAFNGVGPFVNPNAGRYYLSVQDLDTAGAQFGLAVLIPEPASVTLILLGGLAMVHRRRAGRQSRRRSSG